ncbi:hypothetical protein [Nonomuraea dietziae]|uniref:Uncharacterized protein n=1 Tax=Nonomuraea dietziae TaxID=65515 RepID=A0A7W5VDU2_9ACTN|nr:hypothetical protein [Nonomuraea dietziae]MBB3733001.1 hypothetical protein [Nonomuraea dietziae]
MQVQWAAREYRARLRDSDPAVTSALIGPRALDHLHSQLAAADTTLSADLHDAIVAIAVHEMNDTPPALLDPSLRRR